MLPGMSLYMDHKVIVSKYLLSVQKRPEKALVHLHSKPGPQSVNTQLPPFLHGFESHTPETLKPVIVEP